MTEPLLNGKSKIDFSINGDFIDILPTFDERLLPRIIQFNPRLPTINEGSFLAYSNSVESSNSPKRAKTQLILEFFLDDFFNRLVKSENFDSIEYIQAPYQTNGCNIEFCDTGSYIKGSCNGSDQPINLTRLITIEKDGHKQVIIANPTVSKKLKRDLSLERELASAIIGDKNYDLFHLYAITSDSFDELLMPGRKRNNFKKEFCSVVEYLKEPTNLLLVYNFEYGSLMAKSQWFKKTSKQ